MQISHKAQRRSTAISDLIGGVSKTAKKEYFKRYFQSEKGKEARRRYIQSEKGKEARRRYAQSEKGKSALKRYIQSEKGKEAQRRYAQSEKGKMRRMCYLQSGKRKHLLQSERSKEIKTLIESKGLLSIHELEIITGWTRQYTRDLLKAIEDIKEIKFCKGGRAKAKSLELFDGLSLRPYGAYYYVNEDKACEIIVKKLHLKQGLPIHHRKQLTHYLKEILSPSLFNKIYYIYSGYRYGKRQEPLAERTF